jgi:hypothetical protein
MSSTLPCAPALPATTVPRAPALRLSFYLGFTLNPILIGPQKVVTATKEAGMLSSRPR